MEGVVPWNDKRRWGSLLTRDLLPSLCVIAIPKVQPLRSLTRKVAYLCSLKATMSITQTRYWTVSPTGEDGQGPAN